jgi:hypothetical protein
MRQFSAAFDNVSFEPCYLCWDGVGHFLTCDWQSPGVFVFDANGALITRIAYSGGSACICVIVGEDGRIFADDGHDIRVYGFVSD